MIRITSKSIFSALHAERKSVLAGIAAVMRLGSVDFVQYLQVFEFHVVTVDSPFKFPTRLRGAVFRKRLQAGEISGDCAVNQSSDYCGMLSKAISTLIVKVSICRDVTNVRRVDMNHGGSD